MFVQNKYVYHYCSVETFLSIIQNSCLWMGNIRHSNDLTERVSLINALCMELSQTLSPNLSAPEAIRLNDFISLFRYNAQGMYNPCYATCFSFQPDLLSQWRGYADNGSGVAIGFHKEYFTSCAHTQNAMQMQSAGQIQSLSAAPITYITPQHSIHTSIPSYSQYFEQLKLCIQQAIQIPINQVDYNAPMTEQRQHFSTLYANIQQYFNLFLYPANFYKNIAFQEEAEFRLAFCTSADLREVDDTMYAPDFSIICPNLFSISSAKFRYARGQLQPYCEFSFAPCKQSIIGEIRLGPKCTLKASDIYYLLAMNGYLPKDTVFSDRYSTKNIQIIPSSVPYC